jgi:hypothetical protein
VVFVVCAEYWCAKKRLCSVEIGVRQKIMHNGYRCMVHALHFSIAYVKLVHVNYGFIIEK